MALREELRQSTPPPAPQSFSVPEKIALFRSLFRGRTDIFAYRWQSKQGKSGYSVACNNEWVQGVCNKPRIKCQNCSHRQFSQLNDEVIYRHLAGQQVIGLYPLLQDNSCYLLACDFDKGNWQDEVKAMSKACQDYRVPHALEISRSGKGAHLWVFFDEKVPANEARSLGFGLLDKAMDTFPNLSFDSYDRLFPNQDILPEGGFGNLIALPLQREARTAGNSSFVNQQLEVIPDQWQHLAQLKKLSRQDLNKLLAELSPNSNLLDQKRVIDTPLPWEVTAKPQPLTLESPPQQVTITLANHLYLEISELPGPLIARLRRLASFSNPVFFKTQALRFSTQGIPRFISCARIEPGPANTKWLSLPRGCLDETLSILEESNIAFAFDDKREPGTPLSGMNTSFSLRKNQQDAVSAMLRHDTGILHAPTAFGKTVTAISLIAQRKTNALILVHSRQLLDQWLERLGSFLPNVDLGVIRGGKKKPSGVIDIATYQSLINRKDNTISPIVQDYGHVIVDECHHVSAPSFEAVLNEVRAKYVLGLTATPERQDGHQKIIFMAAGPIRHKVKSSGQENFDQEVQVQHLYDIAPEQLTQAADRPRITDVYRWIVSNNNRTQRIVADAIEYVRQGRQPIILTERKEHAYSIYQLLLNRDIKAVFMRGGMSAGDRKAAEQNLHTAQILVATGKYVGEGFDLPRLDTLILAMPIAWKGSLAQYAGRIQRESAGKTRVIIQDYIDCGLPVLQRMYRKREKGYKAMGYTVKAKDDKATHTAPLF